MSSAVDVRSGDERQTAALVPIALVAAAVSSSASADNFAAVYYDASKDELVLTIDYSGTNPDHAFTLRWGECQDSPDGAGARRIVAEVLDDQWQDAARDDFKKTVRFNLGDLRCRPAEVTLRMPPRFYYSLSIPGRASL